MEPSSWVRVEGRLVRALDQTDMDTHAAVIEQIATAVAALQDIVHGLSKRIDRQQAP